MTPVIFLNSTTKTVMCLTVEMPNIEDFEGMGLQITRYEAALKSVMETAVPVAEPMPLILDFTFCWLINGESMIEDKLYPLEKHSLELRAIRRYGHTFIGKHGPETPSTVETVALITKQSDSKQESQEELWKEVEEDYKRSIDMMTFTAYHHTDFLVWLANNSKWTLTRKSTDTK